MLENGLESMRDHVHFGDVSSSRDGMHKVHKYFKVTVILSLRQYTKQLCETNAQGFDKIARDLN